MKILFCARDVQDGLVLARADVVAVDLQRLDAARAGFMRSPPRGFASCRLRRDSAFVDVLLVFVARSSAAC